MTPPRSANAIRRPRPFLLAAGLALACAGGDDRTLLVAGADLAAQPVEAASAPCLGRSEAALSTLDRELVGSPAPYVADEDLAAAESALSGSQRARRRAAWRVAERVLSKTALSPTALSPTAGATAGLPAFQTWYARDDLTRIFRRLYPGLAPEERAARARFAPAAVDAAWAWNDGAEQHDTAWSERRLARYERALQSAEDLAGIGGIYRVSYSPAASRHLLESYPEILGCDAARLSERASMAGALRRDCSDPGPAPVCLASGFPADSVLVKASWRRADAGDSLPYFDTSREALLRRFSAAEGFSWDRADGEGQPPSSAIYTSRLPNGNVFRLAGLHIMSKELEHWFWITLWWSPDPDSDFGADRPSLPPPFDNYKMCSVVAFSERDADPNGGFADDLPTLAAALAATHAGLGGPTWCSNPYLESGAGNALTNCIGCHQHAGTSVDPEELLGDAESFPEFGRTQVRSSFPTDYVFAPTRGDNLDAMFRETEDHYR